MTPIAATLELRVTAAFWEAPEIVSYEFKALDGRDLPEFTAGAHIDLLLPSGALRSYSLTNPQSDRRRYLISVQRDRASRGGSSWIIDNVRPGLVLRAHPPRNNFRLEEQATTSIFIAGGIGVTPILSMINRLTVLDRRWQLFYCARYRDGAPFLSMLDNREGVTLNFDHDPGGVKLDIGAVINQAPEGAHIYCCGPSPMLTEFEKATVKIANDRVHVEYFCPVEAPSLKGGFTVILARSGAEVKIPPGKSILAQLQETGRILPNSCLEGVCGTCETRVLEGVPDHRDSVLTDSERESNSTMMICCSGCKGGRLVLDL